jgi:cell division protein FtsZ
MNASKITDSAVVPQSKPLSIRIIGVGNAGGHVLERLVSMGIPVSSLAAVNTDPQALFSSAVPEILHLETKLLRGLGSGGDPNRGRALAEEQFDRLKSLCEGIDVAFIVAGLGGGAGTGIAPVLARAAKESGALAIAFAMTPFDCEGAHRRQLAEYGLEQLREAADGVVCLANQKLFRLIDENTSVLDTFKFTNGFLAEGVRAFWRLLVHKGLIEIHFEDVCSLIRDGHSSSVFAVAEGLGATRSREVTDKLLAHPMLGDGVLKSSDIVLVSLMGGPDLTMAEVNLVMQDLGVHCPEAQIMMGAVIDEAFCERLTVMVLAGIKGQVAGPESRLTGSGTQEDLGAQLLGRGETTRPGSRFVPPAPDLAPDQVKRLMGGRGSGVRRARNLVKMRQAQLPLEIVSKGRFDKSEPTIHKGEDLDVPTYLRRGISLN